MSKENELEKLKEFSLQMLVDEHYVPVSLEEFAKFAAKHPEIAKYFFDEEEINSLPVPEIAESATIYYHWEKAATRMIASMMKCTAAWIFNQPVDPEKLGIPDYYKIIPQPMDFLTIQKKLKRHDYAKIEEFISDVRLTFANCLKYNGSQSQAGLLCKEMHSEFKNLYEGLNF